MAIETAANIATNVFNRDINSGLIMSNDIEAAEWKYIRGGLMLNYITNGEAIYELIIADMASGEDYEVPGGYLQSALSYYVAAAVFSRIGSGVENRGVMDYTSPNAGKAQPDQAKNVKAEYMENGALWFDKALNWINENLDETYSDVPNTSFDWVTGVGFDASQINRVNVI